MPSTKLRWIALPCLAALFAGCGAGEFDLEIVRAPSECDQKPFSTAPNGYLVVRVDGDGMDSIEFSGRADSIAFDPIEAGENRRVTVRLYSDEKRRELTAMGRSAPFTVGAGNNDPVRVVLYEAGAFRMAANQEGQCSQLRQARAGHTAVRLQDGRVLLAGGFQELNAEGLGVHTLRSAEIFDPVLGTFEALPDMPNKRALAEGVLLKDGRVLLVGGESESGGHRIALNEALIFNPKAKEGENPWSLKQLHAARRGHTATLINQTGHVVVAGGIGEDGEVVDTIEFFDPVDEMFHRVDGLAAQARAFHAAAPVTVGNRPGVLLAGGIDAAGKPTRKLGLVVWSASGYIDNANIPLELAHPAVKPTGVWVDGASHLTLFGGYENWKMPGSLPGEGQGEKLSGWIQFFGISNLSKQQRAEAIQPREIQGPIEACGAAYQKRALAVGGVLQRQGRNPGIAKTGFLLDFNTSPPGASSNLESRVARSMSTCTDLGNGMVLLAGGAGSATSSDGEPTSGNAKAHRDAEIFVFR